MSEKQKMITIKPTDLVDTVWKFFNDSYRLVQIGCTALENEVFEINYSFDKDYNFINVRLSLKSGDDEIPSISSIYWCAFIYENEIHDLFGIRVKDIVIDFKGNFYRLAKKTPFRLEKSENNEENNTDKDADADTDKDSDTDKDGGTDKEGDKEP